MASTGGKSALRWLKDGRSPYVPHERLGPGRPRRSFDVPDQVQSDLPAVGDVDKVAALFKGSPASE